MSESFPAESTAINITTLTNQSIAGANHTVLRKNATEFATRAPPFILRPCTHPKHSAFEDSVPISVICAVFIVFGVVYTLFGYRCFKVIMFLTGCIFGAAIVYYVCTQDAVLPEYAIVGVSLGAGVLFGLITMLVQYVGLLMTGFLTGLLLCLVSIAAADTLDYRINSMWTSSGMLMGFGLLTALLTLVFKKGMTVFGTSLFGSAVLTASLDFFIERWLMALWIWEKVMLKRTIQPCWISWILLGAWPTLALIGLIVQCALTGRGTHHEKSITSKKVRSNQNTRPRGARDQKAEMKQQKYRYLYQVRTAHGDVISQSYVQALQRKVIPGMMTHIGESSTLQSDATHLTTLPVDQMTQLPSSECNTVDSGLGVQFDGGFCNSSRESIQSQNHHQHSR